MAYDNVVQLAPNVSISGAALRVRRASNAAIVERAREHKWLDHVRLERFVAAITVRHDFPYHAPPRILDEDQATYYVTIAGGGNWREASALSTYLGGMSDLLEDARFLVHKDGIDEYVLAGGELTVSRVAGHDDLHSYVESRLAGDPAGFYSYAMLWAQSWMHHEEGAGALRWTDRAIAASPTRWEAHLQRARILVAAGDHREAAAAAERTRELLGPHRFGEGNLRHVEDDISETITEALKQIECVLGECHVALHDHDKADAAFDRAHSIHPRGTFHRPMLLRGSLLLDLGKFEQAEHCFANAMRLASDREAIAAITYQRVRARVLARALPDAMAVLRVAIELEPRYTDHARTDDDLEPLRALPEFWRVVPRAR